MKKKMISLFLCGMMAVTAIVGCGGSGETKSEESGSEVVEIEFWYGLGGNLVKPWNPLSMILMRHRMK